MRGNLLGVVAALGLALTICIGRPGPALGQTRVVNLTLFQQQDLRALAMGNAFGSVARGEAALQYNPAGLALYDFDLKADLSVEAMEETGHFLEDTLNVSSGSPSAQDITNYLNRYDGTSHNYILEVFPSAVANLGAVNFGLGVGNLDTQVWNVTFTQTVPGVVSPADSLTINETRAQIGLGGLGFKLFGGKAFFGITGKTVRYSETFQTQSVAQVTTANKVDLNLQGTNYKEVQAYDAGLIYRVEWFPALRAQWSLTGYNITGYKLTGTDATTGQTNTLLVPETYNFGFSLQPDLGFVHVIISGEYEDLGNQITVQDTSGVNHPRDTSQQLHAGIEVGVIKTPTGNNVLSVRAGSNGGYGSYGAELNLWGFLRAVYTHGEQNFGYKGNPITFTFEGYGVAAGFAW